MKACCNVKHRDVCQSEASLWTIVQYWSISALARSFSQDPERIGEQHRWETWMLSSTGEQGGAAFPDSPAQKWQASQAKATAGNSSAWGTAEPSVTLREGSTATQSHPGPTGMQHD